MNGVDILRWSQRIQVLTGLLACAVALVAWSSGAQAEDTGRGPLILGGEPVETGELRSLAFVAYLVPNGKDEAVVCTGTVIAPRLVLTAAHCVRPPHVRVSVKNFRVVVGDVNWKGPDRKVLDVVQVMSYPRHHGGKGDAALLELATAAKAPPLPLAGRRFWSSGSEAELAGWGVLHPDQHTATYLLHRAATAILGSSECRKAGGHPGQICAEDAPPQKTSACYGDSGGPLLMRRPGDRRLVQIGVVHGGNYCDPESPTLLTSTVPIFSWVRARMAEATTAAAKRRSHRTSP
jgi:secreted trypsin-like serine protease